MVPVTQPEAIEMLAVAFGAEPAEVSPETRREQLPGWDSMGALLLMAELDERFGIQLAAEESRKMRRIGDILELLRAHGALRD